MSKRVLTAYFMHETNTFSRVPTSVESFQKRTFYRANEIPEVYKGTRSAMGAMFEAADRYGWTLVHPISASANPSGIVTDKAFDSVAQMILAALDGPKVDGMVLHLHGAMVVESHEDGEGELLRRVRAKVGSEVPIMVTLDLHANVTRQMAELANALVAFRTYPHIDAYERSWQACELLQKTMTGKAKPRTFIATRPMMHGLDMGRTQKGPMRVLLDRADAIEAKGQVHLISICSGFSHSDIRDVGPTVTVTVDGSDPAGQKIAEDFMDYAWEQRDYVGIELLPVDKVVSMAKAGEGKGKPLVIADYTDNPGGGGYGDSTAVLKGLIDAGCRNVGFHAICDPEAVQQGLKAGVGKTVKLELGGKTDPRFGGGPVEVEAEVAALTDGKMIAWGPMGGGVRRDYGPSMTLRIGGLNGIEVVVITNNGQANDRAQFISMGIDPTRKDTLVVKSMHHFRADFEPIAREVVLVDSKSLCSEHYTRDMFKKVRRPAWPLDPVA
jgi:microcystin degradation protein MlrC